MDESREPNEEPRSAEEACFEAGIKFGSLYHQFAGTPVSPESAPSLARAMEDAIENQPYCESVGVEMDEGAIADAADDEHGYTELTGRFMTVEIEVVFEGADVRARMAMADGYPRMRLVGVERD
ncbi:MAG: dihydroneopterin aldolase family protein [Haloarculaceae archaeon]